MDKKALINTIQAAADQYILLCASAINAELPLEVHESIKLHKVSPPVIDALATVPMLKDGSGFMLRSENGASSLHRNFIAPKLVKKALSTGSAEMAVTWLEKILGTEKAVGFGGVKFFV